MSTIEQHDAAQRAARIRRARGGRAGREVVDINTYVTPFADPVSVDGVVYGHGETTGENPQRVSFIQESRTRKPRFIKHADLVGLGLTGNLSEALREAAMGESEYATELVDAATADLGVDALIEMAEHLTARADALADAQEQA
jgi:hypothetical protein